MNDANLTMEVVALARRAGEAIMSVYLSGESGVTSKADDSPLTLADMASHQIIVDGLRDITPGVPVLSEEDATINYSERKTWRRFWLVDPLDGTKEFIKRNGEFTVNIALIEQGMPVIGVVYAPALDTCYYATCSSGAHVLRENKTARLIRSEPHLANRPMKVVASRSHSDARTQKMLETIGSHEAVSMGSSLKLCLVAEGAAHFYPRLGPTMEWDTAAAHAIVNFAGGRVCDANGNELHYNKPDLHNPEFYVFSADNGVLKRFLNLSESTFSTEHKTV